MSIVETAAQIAAIATVIGAAFSYAVLRPLNASILALKDAVEDMRREMREDDWEVVQ